jgi:hypothetical protein
MFVPSEVVPTCSLVRLDAVDLVGLRDVQLVQVGDLLEVCALVKCTAQARLPHGGVVLVAAHLVFPFVHSPSLMPVWDEVTQISGPHVCLSSICVFAVIVRTHFSFLLFSF